MTIEPAMKRKIAAILAADVVGYSRLVAEDEEGTIQRLISFRQVFADSISRANGRIFNTAGDAVLAEFPSAVDALRTALEIQETIRRLNASGPKNQTMQFRIGVTVGDIVERDGDLLGDAVNIAARLESLAVPGGICVSKAVYEQVDNRVQASFRDIGLQTLKNIRRPVHVFGVTTVANEVGARRSRRNAFGSGRLLSSRLMRVRSAGVACIAIVTATALLWSSFRAGGTAPTPGSNGSEPSARSDPWVSVAPRYASDGSGVRPASRANPSSTWNPAQGKATFAISSLDSPTKVDAYSGTVSWTTVFRVGRAVSPPLSFRADVELTDLAMTCSVLFSRNDGAGSAWAKYPYKIEIRFAQRPGNTLGPVQEIQMPRVASVGSGEGEQLLGGSGRVSEGGTYVENQFDVYLSDGTSGLRDIELIGDREEFEIPLRLKSGRVAKLTFEKGEMGTGKIKEALGRWLEQERSQASSATDADAR